MRSTRTARGIAVTLFAVCLQVPGMAHAAEGLPCGSIDVTVVSCPGTQAVDPTEGNITVQHTITPAADVPNGRGTVLAQTGDGLRSLALAAAGLVSTGIGALSLGAGMRGEDDEA